MIDLNWFRDLSRADFLKSAGLYVTPDRLYLVRLRKDLFRLSLIEEEIREIPSGEDAASRRQAIGEALRSFLSRFDLAKEPFYVCLSPDQVVSLELFLPQAAAENLSQVVEYEIERYLPFRREEVYYDFLPLGKKGDKVGLLLFAVPRRIVDEILDTLAAFGVKPRAVESSATALSNYLLFCAGAVTGSALVLGGQNNAWELIGLRGDDNGWRRERKLLFAHWLPQTEWAQGPGRAFFHGALEESTRLFTWGYISDLLLSLGVESLKCDDLLVLGKEKFAGKKGLGHPLFLPAVGAALRGLREATFTLNLLPGAKEEGRRKALSWVNASLALLLLIGLAVWGASYPVRDEIRLRQLQKENQKLAPAVEVLRKEEEELNRLRKETGLLSGLKERRGVILRMLDELSRVVPNNAYLSNLRFREGTVELHGSAENASHLVPLLERSALFENVTFNAPSSRSRDNRESFSLKAEIERPKGSQVKR